MHSLTLWRLNWALLLLHGIGAVLAWSALPQRIPIHFGLGAAPDAWATTSLASWFGLFAVSAVTSTFIHALSRYGPLTLWNIPEKERFLQLSPRQRAPVLELLYSFMAAAAICTTVALLALHLGLYLVASGRTPALPWYTQAATYGGFVLLLVGLVPWSRAVRRAVLHAANSE